MGDSRIGRSGLSHISDLMPKVLDSHGIKPIETLYDGVRFRSRLEARWAVFFNAVGIPWEYEKEGYDIGGEWYLPDFWLPTWESFAEIKPKILTESEEDKCRKLCQLTQKQCFSFVAKTGFPNDPTEWEQLPTAMMFSPPCGAGDVPGYFAMCPECKAVGMLFYPGIDIHVIKHGADCSATKTPIADSRAIVDAYKAARIERFIR